MLPIVNTSKLSNIDNEMSSRVKLNSIVKEVNNDKKSCKKEVPNKLMTFFLP